MYSSFVVLITLVVHVSVETAVLVDLKLFDIAIYVVGDSVLSVLVLSEEDVVDMSMVGLLRDSLMVADVIEQLVEREEWMRSVCDLV